MKRSFLFLIGLSFFINNMAWSTPQYYCTGVNSLFFKSLLNLIGSIHKHNYENLEEIAVFDLGMTFEEQELVKKLAKVKLYSLKENNPDLLKNFSVPTQSKLYLGWYAWKPVIIKEALESFPYVLWIDAGSTVLRPLDGLFDYIQKEGFFLCTSGDELQANDFKKFKHPIGWGATNLVKSKFQLTEAQNQWILDKETVMGGLVGVSKLGQGAFLQDWYGLTKEIKYFADDGSTPNGWGTCRHDQTLLSILAYTKGLKVHVKDFSQVFPIDIGIDNLRIPFYLTWNSRYINEKTFIYIQSGLYQFEDHLKSIKYR